MASKDTNTFSDSNFKIDIDKNIVTYQNETFQFYIPQKKFLIYRCQTKTCSARIRLNKTKTKIVGGTFTHTSHITRSNDKKESVGQNKAGQNQAQNSPRSKLKTPNKTLVLKNTDKRQSIELTPHSPQTQDAEKKIQNKENIETCSAKPCTINSDTSTMNSDRPDTHSATLEGQIKELKILTDGLVDQLMEKEKIIIQRDTTIASLKEEIQSLEEKLKNSNIARAPETPKFKKTTSNAVPKEINNKDKSDELHIRNVSLVRNKNIKNNDKFKSHLKYYCNIVGDSHCRGLSYYMKRYTDRVETFFKPGCGFAELKDASTIAMSNLSSDDKIVYFCGTNDIENRNWGPVFNAIDHIIQRHNSRQIVFILVPIRWDRPLLNTLVQRFNNKLRDKLREHNISYLDPNYFLRPWHYARDGLHLNINGKRVLCLKLNFHLQKCTLLGEHTVVDTNESTSNRNIIENNSNCIDVYHTYVTPQARPVDCVKPKPNVLGSVGSSFIIDQSYTYDLSNLSLLNNVNVSTHNPSLNVDDCQYVNVPQPISCIPSTSSDTPKYVHHVNSSADSTFSFSPRAMRIT